MGRIIIRLALTAALCIAATGFGPIYLLPFLVGSLLASAAS